MIESQGARGRTWLWATLAILLGIAVLVVLDLIEDPDSTTSDVVLNLLEEVPLILIVVGVVALYQITQRYRDEKLLMLQDLATARALGQHWRNEARAHLNGLGDAIAAQFQRWELTAAEREVALLLLKGLSTKEIAAIRSTSERTVREQARAAYGKAGLTGRAALSAYFLEDLLAPVESWSE